MAEASDVVRTRRVEVVDDRGRVRVLIGALGDGEDGPVFGLVVKDVWGHSRAWVVHDGTAGEFGLDFEGENVAALSVSDSGDPHLYLRESDHTDVGASRRPTSS